MLLSKNNTFHRYDETEEEWFLEHVSKMMNDPLTNQEGGPNIDELRLKYSAMGREKGTTYGEIFGSPGGVEMLINLWTYNKYYRRTKMFAKGYLKKNVLGRNMGVSHSLSFIIMFQSSVRRSCRCWWHDRLN
jgi:hypothetical protein